MANSDPLATGPPPTSPVQPPPATETSAIILSTTPPRDPPPPYPSRERRIRSPRIGRRRRVVDPDSEHPHLQIPSMGNESDHEGLPIISPYPPLDDREHDASETTPLLSPSIGGGGGHSPRLLHSGIRRQRTLSISSTVHSSTSFAPSFAQTVLSALNPDRDSDLDPDCESNGHGGLPQNGDAESRLDSSPAHLFIEDQNLLDDAPRLRRRQSCSSSWRKYFRPLGRKAYYSALFHLLLVNFPYALIAWIYLFVFTLVRTCFASVFHGDGLLEHVLESRPVQLPSWHSRWVLFFAFLTYWELGLSQEAR